MKDIDYQAIVLVLRRFIQDFLGKNGFQKTVIGLSGGIDSAVVLALLVDSMGPSGITALMMPYRLSDPKSLEDAGKLCDRYKVHNKTIDISPMIDAYFASNPSEDRLLIGNKCARERMSILYDYSHREQSLVAGTSNKSELLIGYSTLYGDSAAAFLPIGDLYKSRVFELARFLELPEDIIRKNPSADLWKDQTDEKEIGLSYSMLDRILEGLVDHRLSVEAMEKEYGFDRTLVDQVLSRIRTSQYKRCMPPVAKLTPRTVGIDFRYSIDWYK